jgi:glycosyltransferase involved in cell wall biosynthesis
MLVSIILCTYQRATQLEQTLESLGRVSVPDGCQVELCLVENGPKDTTEAVFRRSLPAILEGRYFHEPKKGKSRALNRGIAEAKGEIFLFIDDDLRFPESWLREMCEPIWSGRSQAVVGGIVLPESAKRPWMTRYHEGWLGCIRYSDPQNPDEMAGANMAFHRQVLDKVPRFDLELGGGGLGNCEDTLFSRQVCAAGFPLAASAVAVEHHFDPVKLRYLQWVRNAEAAGRSRAYLIHHWQHEVIRSPLLREAYFTVKLRARLGRRPPPKETDEGIAPWELSYRFDLAKFRHFRVERRRPRNYDRLGLIKLRGQI